MFVFFNFSIFIYYFFKKKEKKEDDTISFFQKPATSFSFLLYDSYRHQHLEDRLAALQNTSACIRDANAVVHDNIAGVFIAPAVQVGVDEL